MTILTIRMPEDKHERLRAVARSRNVSVNKLIEELATVSLANHDVFLRFQFLAAAVNPRRALSILQRLHEEASI